MTDATWLWFEVSVDGAAAGITPSQVFRGRAVEQVLAREAIQNSWDASRRYLDEDRKHQCLVTFEYRSIGGPEKATLIDTLGLRQLGERAVTEMALADEVGKGMWARALDSPDPLPVLFVSDYGAHGLYGAPRLLKDSPLWLAMRATSITNKKRTDDAMGGSFGLGKGALLYASHAGIIVAYSRFDPLPDDPVTRRLEGAARWPDHQFKGLDWTGQARFGRGENADPFEDEDADAVARALGVHDRITSDELPFPGADPRGTTFMIVDPRLDPDRLRPAVEEFWWPALARGEYADNLLVQVEIDGEIDNPGPSEDVWREDLAPYVRALDVAQRRGEPPARNEQRIELSDGGLGQLGTLGLVMLPSDADEETSEDSVGGPTDADNPHARDGAVVALTRIPRMVVEYHSRNTRRNIRGIFVAADALNNELRASEPPTHDEWGGDPDGPNVGLIVKKAINKTIREFARDARPPRVPGEARIPALDRWLASFAGRGPGETDPNPRPFQIQGPEGQRIETKTLRHSTDPPDTIRASVTFRVRLNPDAKIERNDLDASVSVFAHHLDEDDRPITNLDGLAGTFEKKPFTFQEVRQGVVRGRIARDRWGDFYWVSRPYERDSRVGCSVHVEY